MKHRGFVAAGLTAALVGLAGCGGGGAGDSSGQGDQPDNLTVWLMSDAKNGWPQIVKAANQQFEKEHPDVKVQVRYQDWGDYLTKFEARIGAGNPPDVLEMGNTQTVKYMASGALLPITKNKDSFDNSGSWLGGLEQSCTFAGELYCVPYYAATRTVIYRKDMFEQADVAQTPPTSLAEFTKIADKLMAEYGDKENYSAFYFPGKYWYLAMSFVYDYGGQIAVQENGTWNVTLDEPAARRGLQKAKEILMKYSAASRTGDEAEQAQTFADGGVGMFYGLGWEVGVAVSPETGNPELEGKLDQFALPSHNPGQTMPAFIGGSDLAVPASSDATELAQDWIRIYTGNESMQKLTTEGGVIPNTSSLLNLVASDAQAKAAENNWFVPVAENWASVEQRNLLANMLVDIFTEKATVKQATAAASKQIEQVLNGS